MEQEDTTMVINEIGTELLAQTSEVIRPYAENIIRHTATIYSLEKLTEQVDYIKDKEDRHFLTPVEASILWDLVDYKFADLEGMKGRPQTERIALRRIMGTQTMKTLDELDAEYKGMAGIKAVDLAFKFKDNYIRHSEVTLLFWDLVRLQAFKNDNKSVEAGNWTRQQS